MTRDDEDIRGLLAGAVPPLAAPPDRVAEVGIRVRRHRRRMAGGAAAVALTVGLGVGLPNLVAGPDGERVAPVTTPSPQGDAACPTSLDDRPELASVRYGDDEPLVPTGAVEVTSCQVPVGSGPDPAYRLGPRTLTTGVDEIVRLLNSQPPTQQDGQGRPLPDGQELRCTLKASTDETVLVLRYPDRDPVTVWTDYNCRVTVTATHGRGTDIQVAITFLDRYRAQLAATTDPASVTSPACPATFPVERMRKNSGHHPPNWIRFNNTDPYRSLPDPLVEFTACRYVTRGETGELVGQQRRRADADEVRDPLNGAFGRSSKSSDCGDKPDYQEPTVFDTLTVADVTGETAEFWIRHEPCRSVNNQVLTPELLDVMTDLLGQPPSR
ncbi:hypothetical protein [Micromonospora palythoicola]|uniref:hypothetical protein n=1 Tax=Micromonospora palythoicola TaxID=3120507 RepID=UPI002FCE16E6